jgi:hypothetical protein
MANTPRVTVRPRVVTAADAKKDPTLKEDDFIQKVVRYIPGEIVGAYTTASGLVLGASGTIPKVTVLWIVIVVLGVLTPLWLKYATDIPGKSAATFQIVAGTVAYLVWVFAMSGGTLFPTWYDALYGSLLLLFFTLATPIAEKMFVK